MAAGTHLILSTHRYFLFRYTGCFTTITVGGDFLSLCDEKSSYKHVSDFGQLQSYDRLKLRIEGNDY